MEWLDKLRQAYELLDRYGGQAAVGLREFADFLHKVEEGARQAADFLDGPTAFGAAGSEVVDEELEELRSRVASRPAPARTTGPVGAGGFWIAIASELLLKVIEEIIRKRREK